MSVNLVQLSGGLVRDPTFAVAGDHEYGQCQLAVNGTRYNPETGEQVVKTTFVFVQFWGPLCDELRAHNLGQGDEIYVTGELGQQPKKDRDTPSTRVFALQLSVVRRTRGSFAPSAGQPWTDGS